MIPTADLWCWNWPLYQLSHNHWPILLLLVYNLHDSCQACCELCISLLWVVTSSAHHQQSREIFFRILSKFFFASQERKPKITTETKNWREFFFSKTFFPPDLLKFCKKIVPEISYFLIFQRVFSLAYNDWRAVYRLCNLMVIKRNNVIDVSNRTGTSLKFSDYE